MTNPLPGQWDQDGDNLLHTDTPTTIHTHPAKTAAGYTTHLHTIPLPGGLMFWSLAQPHPDLPPPPANWAAADTEHVYLRDPATGLHHRAWINAALRHVLILTGPAVIHHQVGDTVTRGNGKLRYRIGAITDTHIHLDRHGHALTIPRTLAHTLTVIATAGRADTKGRP